MPTLLRIDSSSRLAGSNSSQLADIAEEIWRASHSQGQVISRHLGQNPIPVLSQDTIAGFFTPEDALSTEMKAATALSDTLIDELQSADMLLLAAPIYNFSVPAALKCWIDQITRIGHTFAYENGAFTGLARTPRAIVICAYGAEGYLEGQSFAQANFLEPYLRFLLGFLGIGQVDFISVQNTSGDPDSAAANAQQAEADLRAALV